MFTFLDPHHLGLRYKQTHRSNQGLKTAPRLESLEGRELMAAGFGAGVLHATQLAAHRVHRHPVAEIQRVPHAGSMPAARRMEHPLHRGALVRFNPAASAPANPQAVQPSILSPIVTPGPLVPVAFLPTQPPGPPNPAHQITHPGPGNPPRMVTYGPGVLPAAGAVSPLRAVTFRL